MSEPEPTGDDPLAALGGLDMSALLGAAQSIQAQVQESQERLASTVIVGQAGGGVVRVEVNGGFEFRAVHIDPSVIDPTDPSMLEDLVLAALRDAGTQVVELQTSTTPLGNLGGLGDLLGG
jgi:DNA-binding YbaB/EbfC family protein